MACQGRQDKMDKVLTIRTDYLDDAFRDPEYIADKACKALKDVNYDTMVGIGLSGSLVVPILARALGKYWCIVRKEDGSHTHNRVEGQIGQRCLFVDDCVDSGRSRERVKSVIEEVCSQNGHWDKFGTRCAFPTEWIGTYTYMNNKYDPHDRVDRY